MLHNILVKILAIPAKIIINRFDPKIIGVTGSAGKTSTKEAIFEVLSKSKKYQRKVGKAYGNLNTEVGMPLAILGFKDAPSGLKWIWAIFLAYFRTIKLLLFRKFPEILVLEYSVDKPGDMKYLTAMVQPDVAVITQIGAAHLHTFKNVNKVAEEKIQLATSLKPDGIAILNEDNEYIKKYAKQIFFDKIWYHGDSFDSAKGAARVVAQIFDIDKNETDLLLKKLPLVEGRMNIFCGIKNTTLIDDSYNANPLSMRRALKFLASYKSSPSASLRVKKIAILGDMRELGEATGEEHQKLAKMVAKTSDFTITIGPAMQKYAKPVLEKMHHPHQSFLNVTSAKNIILKNIAGEEIILIKASQNTLFLERITEMLLADKKEVKNLCRQSKDWLKIKAKTP